MTSQDINASEIYTKKINANEPKHLHLQIRLAQIEEGLFLFHKINAVFKVLEIFNGSKHNVNIHMKFLILESPNDKEVGIVRKIGDFLKFQGGSNK